MCISTEYYSTLNIHNVVIKVAKTILIIVVGMCTVFFLLVTDIEETLTVGQLGKAIENESSSLNVDYNSTAIIKQIWFGEGTKGKDISSLSKVRTIEVVVAYCKSTSHTIVGTGTLRICSKLLQVENSSVA